MATVIDILVERHDAVLEFLRDASQLSMAIEFEDGYKKLLIMACGSFFESHLIAHICEFSNSAADVRVAELVKNKISNRQYHSFFSWEAANVNQFLAMFGTDYKKYVSQKVESDEALMRGMRSFLQIGAERNRLAHGNLGNISPDLTVDEIKQRYRAAWFFLQFLCDTLRLPAQ